MTTARDENKAFVPEAFDTLFNKRDYAAAERFWSPDYTSTALIFLRERLERIRVANEKRHAELFAGTTSVLRASGQADEDAANPAGLAGGAR